MKPFTLTLCMACLSVHPWAVAHEDDDKNSQWGIDASSRLIVSDESGFSEAAVLHNDTFKLRLGGLFSSSEQAERLTLDYSLSRKFAINDDMSMYFGLGGLKDELSFDYELSYDLRHDFILNAGYRFFLDDDVEMNRNQFFIGFTVPFHSHGVQTEPKPLPVSEPPQPEPKPPVVVDSSPQPVTTHVYFGFDHYSPVDASTLVDIARKAAADARAFVVINGYSDATGRADYNLRLSQQRADSVYRWLLNHGVQAKQMKVTAFGETEAASISADSANERRTDVIYYPIKKTDEL
ncbi:OmpA family protein [Vibrio alginolyticus]|nr:OmpA family protein [Vibrio alginolyticus]